MFKIIVLFAIVAVASVSAKADPKPGLIAYSAPVVAAAPVATFFEQSFHGNFAPAAVVADPFYSTPYLAPPLAYSYSAYDPFLGVAAPATVLLK